MLPKKLSAEIKERFGGMTRGFGSLPVQVTIGKTVWKTSIFPDNQVGAYLLFIKIEVRRNEKITVDDNVNIRIEIVV